LGGGFWGGWMPCWRPWLLGLVMKSVWLMECGGESQSVRLWVRYTIALEDDETRQQTTALESKVQMALIYWFILMICYSREVRRGLPRHVNTPGISQCASTTTGNNNPFALTYSRKLPTRSQPKVLQQILWSGFLAGNRGSDVEQELSDWSRSVESTTTSPYSCLHVYM
jgi:hypothetical protein